MSVPPIPVLTQSNNTEIQDMEYTANKPRVEAGEKIVTIIIGIIIIVLVGVSMKRTADSFRKTMNDNTLGFFNALFGSISSYKSDVSNHYSANYNEIFEHSLIGAKGGLIIFLSALTLYYEYHYGKVPHTKTFFGSFQYRWRGVADLVCTSLFGMLSAGLVCWSRGKWTKENIGSNITTMLIVGLVLGLFNMTEESSGFNRWLAVSETEKGEGPYYEIDVENGDYTASNLQTFAEMEESGDPFIMSISKISIGVLVLTVVFLIIKMMYAAKKGYDSGSNSFEEAGLSKLHVFLELVFAVGLINTIPVLLAPKIRGEKFGLKNAGMGVGFFTVGVVLQVMLQYSGMFKEAVKTVVSAPVQ